MPERSRPGAADPRRLLVTGVAEAALMQVATVDANGFPAICQVWYQPAFEPDRLRFLSREDREHVINLRRDPRVAASIALEVPAGLGERVRGVTLIGLAREIPEAELSSARADFVRRWPRAADALRPVPGPVASPPIPRPGGPAGVGPAPTRPLPADPAAAPRTRPTGAPRSRLYEIIVERWVLFDEVNFPAEPRLTVPAH